MTEPRLVLLAALLVPLAAAADEPLRAAVLPCAGKGGVAASRRIAESLSIEEGLKVIGYGAVKQALRGGRLAGTADFARLANRLELDAIVSCKMLRGGGGRAQVVLRDSDGAVVDRLKWSNKRRGALAEKIAELSEDGEVDGDETWEEDEPATKPEPAPAAAPAPRKRAVSRAEETDRAEVVAEAEAPPAPAGRSTRYVEVALLPGMISRDFTYYEELPAGSRALRHALPAPVLTAFAEAFPFNNLGVHLAGQMQIGAKTRLSDGSTHDSTGYGVEGGIQGRLRFGPAEARARFTAGQQVQDTGITGHVEHASPRVAYTFLQPTLGARVTLFSRLTLQGEAGFRFLLGAGELSSKVYLQQTVAGGLEVSALASFAITQSIEVRVHGSFRRYFFKAIPNGDLLYGAAVDQYLQGGIGLAYRFGF